MPILKLNSNPAGKIKKTEITRRRVTDVIDHRLVHGLIPKKGEDHGLRERLSKAYSGHTMDQIGADPEGFELLSELLKAKFTPNTKLVNGELVQKEKDRLRGLINDLIAIQERK